MNLNTYGVIYDKKDFIEFKEHVRDNIYFINDENTNYYLNQVSLIIIGCHDSLFELISYFMDYEKEIKLPYTVEDIVEEYLDLGGKYILDEIELKQLNCYCVHEHDQKYRGIFCTPEEFAPHIGECLSSFDIKYYEIEGGGEIIKVNRLELFYKLYEYFFISYEYYSKYYTIQYLHSFLNLSIISDYNNCMLEDILYKYWSC